MRISLQKNHLSIFQNPYLELLFSPANCFMASLSSGTQLSEVTLPPSQTTSSLYYKCPHFTEYIFPPLHTPTLIIPRNQHLCSDELLSIHINTISHPSLPRIHCTQITQLTSALSPHNQDFAYTSIISPALSLHHSPMHTNKIPCKIAINNQNAFLGLRRRLRKFNFVQRRRWKYAFARGRGS